VTARLRTPGGTIELYVESYNTALNLASNQAILRRGRVQYPFTPNQRPLHLTLTCPSEAYKARLQKLIRASQEAALNTDGKASDTVALIWPERDIYYQGFITSAPGGGQRWEHVSTVELDMLLVYDAFHTRRANFSEEGWKQEWEFDEKSSPEGFQTPLLPDFSTAPTERKSILESLYIFGRK